MSVSNKILQRWFLYNNDSFSQNDRPIFKPSFKLNYRKERKKENLKNIESVAKQINLKDNKG